MFNFNRLIVAIPVSAVGISAFCAIKKYRKSKADECLREATHGQNSNLSKKSEPKPEKQRNSKVDECLREATDGQNSYFIKKSEPKPVKTVAAQASKELLLKPFSRNDGTTRKNWHFVSPTIEQTKNRRNNKTLKEKRSPLLKALDERKREAVPHHNSRDDGAGNKNSESISLNGEQSYTIHVAIAISALCVAGFIMKKKPISNFFWKIAAAICKNGASFCKSAGYFLEAATSNCLCEPNNIHSVPFSVPILDTTAFTLDHFVSSF